MKKSEAEGLFAVAGFKVLRIWRLPNNYITSREEETDEDILREAVYRHRRPWWLVKTEHGLIEIGPRKRVIEIDWSDTGVQVSSITDDNVTKGTLMVHAWSMSKAVEYLTTLHRALVEPITVRGKS